MDTKAVLLLLVVLLSSQVAAQNVTESTDYDLDEFQDRFNANSDKVPGFLASIIGGQRINLHLEKSNRTVKIQMEGINMSEIEDGEWESPTLEVWASEEDLEEVVGSEDRAAALKQEIDSGDIRYRERGLVNKMKFFVARLFL